jgi:hypothetical protein
MRWFALIIPALFACTPTTQPVEMRVLGSIAGYNLDDPRIEIHGGVRSALVRVTTYGGGCHRKGEVDVHVDGLVAEVAPYDYVLVGEGVVCTDILLTFQHEVTLDFKESGEAEIIVIGLNLHDDTVRVQRLVNVD